MTNPFTSSKKIFAAYASVWFLIFLSHVAIIMIVQSINFYSAVIDSSFFNFLYLVIGIGIWYTVRFNNLENYTPLKIFLNHIVSAVITAGIWVAAGEFIVSKILSQEKLYLEFLNKSIIWRFLIGILYYIAIVSINYVIIYYNNFQEKVLKEVELKGLVKEAELNALKYQINPHFIFNSLNSISSLTLSNPQRAQDIIIKLSCGIEKEYFKISVENNFDPESVPRKGAGIGIKNIQNRMKLIYNQDNLVVVDKKDSNFKVTIYVPMSGK